MLQLCKRTVSAVALWGLTWPSAVLSRDSMIRLECRLPPTRLARSEPAGRPEAPTGLTRAVPPVATERLLIVGVRGCYGGEVAAAGIIRQGTSSSMRLMVWPSAILARISLR